MQDQTKSARQPYHAPELRVHGTIADLTRASTFKGRLDNGSAPYTHEEIPLPGSR